MSSLTTLPEDCLLQIATKCHRHSILDLRLVSTSLAALLNRISTHTVATLLSEDFRPGLFQLPRDGVVECMRYIQQQHCRLAVEIGGVYKGAKCTETRVMAQLREHIAHFDKNFYNRCLEKYDTGNQELRASVVMRVTFEHTVKIKAGETEIELLTVKNNQGRVLVWEIKAEENSRKTRKRRRLNAVNSLSPIDEFKECWMIPTATSGGS